MASSAYNALSISKNKAVGRHEEGDKTHGEEFDIFVIAPTRVDKRFKYMRRQRLTKRMPGRFSGEYKRTSFHAFGLRVCLPVRKVNKWLRKKRP